MKLLLFVSLVLSTYAEQCLNGAQCEEFKSAYPTFANINSDCEITINNSTNCIIYCERPCSYPSFAPGMTSKYHYKSLSNEYANKNETVKTNCNLLSVSIINATKTVVV